MCHSQQLHWQIENVCRSLQLFYNKNKTAAIELSLNLSPSLLFTMLPSTGRYQLFNYLYLLLVITTIHLQGEKIFITMGKCNFNDPTPKLKCWTILVRLFLEENYIRNHQHFEKR